MAELELVDVTKRFADGSEGGVVAVDAVSLAVEDGEFLVLVGPSGCGKSTTLRMIAGLERPTDGEMRIGGELVNRDPPQDRDIAMVFQSYALYPHMTVRGNMAFGLEESTELPDDEIAEQVEETATMMGIGELLDRKPGDLSGGQQQRVALGRAIVRDPAVFLMDEPLSNLDAKLRAEMRTELQRLQEELGVTTVYVTHDQTEAMTMGDRIAILNEGRLQQVGTPLTCYHQPANLFVAGFLGEPSMNLFDARRTGDRLVADGFEYPLSSEIRDALGEATELVFGIRPEDVAIGRHGGDDPYEFDVTIDVVEPVGNEHNVYARFEGEREPSLIATVGGMERVREDEQAVATLDEDAIHLFDARTGNALWSRRLESLAELEPKA